MKGRKIEEPVLDFDISNINNYLVNNLKVSSINTNKLNVSDEKELSEMMIIKKMEEIKNQ